MTVAFSALVPAVAAAVLFASWKPQSAVLLPLVFHAAYLLRSRLPLVELPTTMLELLVVVAVGVAVVRACARARARAEYGKALRALPRSALLCVGLFLVAATVAAAVAPHPRTAWGHWKAFVVEPILYAAALLPLTRSVEGRSAIMRALLLGGAVSSSFSLAAAAVEYVRPYPLSPAPYTLTADFSRLRGIYDVPNSLALVLAPLTVFAVVLAVSSDPSSPRRLARRLLIIFVPTLLLTQSLGGLLAAGVSLAVLSVMRRRALLPPMVAGARGRGPRGFPWRSVVAAALLLAIGLFSQLASGKLRHAFAENSPLQARRRIWAVSRALIRDHPLLGTGLGTFEPAYQAKLRQLITENAELGTLRSQSRVSSSQFPLEWVVRDPHHVLLSFWLNTGLLGLVSMGGLVVLALRAAWRSVRRPTAHPVEGPVGPHGVKPRGGHAAFRGASSGCLLPVASSSALVALLVFGLVDVPYLKNDLSLLWWTFLLFAFAGAFREEKIYSEDPRTAG